MPCSFNPLISKMPGKLLLELKGKHNLTIGNAIIFS